MDTANWYGMAVSLDNSAVEMEKTVEAH